MLQGRIGRQEAQISVRVGMDATSSRDSLSDLDDD